MSKKYYYSFIWDLPTGGFPAKHPADDKFIGGYYDIKELRDVTKLILSYTRELIQGIELEIDASSRLIIEKYDSEDDVLSDIEIHSYSSYEYNLFFLANTLEKINEKDIVDELSLAFDSFHRFSEGPPKNQVDVYRDSRVKVLGDIHVHIS